MIIGQFWGPFWYQNGTKHRYKIDFETILAPTMGAKIDFEVDWDTLEGLGGRLGGPWRVLGGALLKNNVISWDGLGKTGVPGKGRAGVNPYPKG